VLSNVVFSLIDQQDLLFVKGIRMKLNKILFFVFLLFSFAAAQNYKQVKIYLSGNDDIKALIEQGISIDHFSTEKDNSIIVFLSDTEFSILSYLGFRYDILIDNWFEHYDNLPKLSDAERQIAKEKSKVEYGVEGFGFGSMGSFYTFQEAIAQLDTMYANYPNLITQKFSIGTSIDGRQIWAVKISDNPNINENEPAVGFDALIHAREPQSMETLIYFMYYLLENYGTNPEVTYLVNNREIYCIPVFNPDGYEYNRSTNPNGGGMWRKNRRLNTGGSFGVDLNRNFSYKWGYDNVGSSPTPSSDSYRGTAPFSEPEAQSVSQFFASKNIKTHFNMHTYSDAILYPWGYIDALTTDSLTYKEFANDMSAYNGYEVGNSYQILGYPSNGSVRDWMYGEQASKNKVYGYTIEIGSSSDGFWPPQSRIFPIAQINVKVNLYQVWVAGEYPALVNSNFNQQYFNPGNFVQFQPSFKNKGLSTAKNVAVSLTSLSPYATVNSSSIIIDSIPARGTMSSSIPLSFTIASNAPAEHKLNLLLTTSLSGMEVKKDTIKLIIGTPEYIFIDTTNNPLTYWTISATPSTPFWESTTTSYYSSPNSYTDSKSGNYVNNATVTMTMTNPINLSSYANPKLSFWTKYDLENNWDYGQVEISTNNGSTWTALAGTYTNLGTGSFQPNGQPLYDGVQSNWVREEISLTGLTSAQVKFRFKLRTDGSQTRDGWYVDDIGVLVYTTVPVELINFTAFSEENQVRLSWTTVTETNNKGFEIERRLTEGEWSTIGFVEGHGTITEPKEYTFNDKQPVREKSYYRLKQIDYDGTTKTYEAVEVKYGKELRYELGQNYPNPFNPKTTIRWKTPADGWHSIKVYDVLGNEVAVVVNEYKPAGSYEVEFNKSTLSSGLYIYTLKTGNNILSKKMLILK
jgi:murein tripeptide amidase MpaA